MTSAIEPVDKYFDLERFPFRGLFDGVANVWETLSAIKSYLAAYNEYNIECAVPAGAWLANKDKIAVGEGTVIENGATITGPAIIGRDCVIRQGAYIRGNLVAGDGCVIGHTTEVKNSVFLNGAKAAHFAYVGDSILGVGVNLGAGTKLANFKIDTGERNVSLTIGGEVIATGLRKLGAILGDGAEIGCNSVTMPGTIIGKNTLVYPCVLLRGIVGSGRIIKLRQQQNIEKKRTQ